MYVKNIISNRTPQKDPSCTVYVTMKLHVDHHSSIMLNTKKYHQRRRGGVAAERATNPSFEKGNIVPPPFGKVCNVRAYLQLYCFVLIQPVDSYTQYSFIKVSTKHFNTFPAKWYWSLQQCNTDMKWVGQV